MRPGTGAGTASTSSSELDDEPARCLNDPRFRRRGRRRRLDQHADLSALLGERNLYGDGDATLDGPRADLRAGEQTPPGSMQRGARSCTPQVAPLMVGRGSTRSPTDSRQPEWVGVGALWPLRAMDNGSLCLGTYATEAGVESRGVV